MEDGLVENSLTTNNMRSTKIIGTVAFALAMSFCVNASATLNLNPSVPGTPNITSLVGSSKQVKVSFTAPSNGGSSITQYTVTPYIGGVAQTTTSGKSGPITVTDLTNGVSYTFTVYATNSDGNSASSNPSNPIVPSPNIYYLSSSMGNDNNTLAEAQNPATPWKTLTKLNSIMKDLLPGDEVLFNSGDTFPGTISIKVSGALNNPITFSAYGTGNKPLFDSRLSLTNWNNVGANLWEASNPSLVSMPTALYMNDTLKSLGRFPTRTAANGGYLTINATPNDSTYNQFTCNALNGTTNFTGAEVAIKVKHWCLNRLQSVVQSGNQISFASPKTKTSYPIVVNYGFFFQNHPNCLVNDGDWCYLSSNDSIEIYSTSNPAKINIAVANTNSLITDTSYSYIVIDNLAFIGAKKSAIAMYKVKYCSIINCSFNQSGTNDINIANGYSTGYADSITISNNTMSHAQGNSTCVSGTRVSITGNTLTNVSTISGMGENGEAYIGLKIDDANGLLVQNNTIDSVGYDGISFAGSNILITQNVISNFGSVLDDCGGIYTFDTGNDSVVNRTISNNIIYNGIGAPLGTNEPSLSTNYFPANGIYLDGIAPNVLVTGNTVANMAGYGFQLNGGSSNTIKNNTTFNCGITSIQMHQSPTVYSANKNLESLPNYSTANDIENNTFINISSTPCTNLDNAYWLNMYQIDSAAQAGFGQFGIVNNNIYCNPFLQDDYMLVKKYTTSTSANLFHQPLSGWQNTTGYDLNSTTSPVHYPLDSSLASANLIANGTFNTNSSGWNFYKTSGRINHSVVSGILDGNCLSVQLVGASSSVSGIAAYSLPPITAGSYYKLGLSTLGTKTGTLQLELLNANFKPVSRTINIGTVREDKQILFKVDSTTSSSVLYIYFTQVDSTVYLDNISLYQVNPTNPSNYVRFAYNPTHTDSSIIADKNYITPNGKIYSYGSLIPIPSFGSVVLLKDTTAINLPINFIGISATKNKEGVKVEWNVANEENSSHYLVERSSNGISFNTIDSINANGRGTYQVLDNHLQINENNLYYRIKAVSATGEISYTNIAKVTYNVQLITYNLFPNPLNGNILNVSLTNVAAGKYVASICNLLGKKVGEQTFSHNGGSANHSLAINNTLAAGIYSVVIRAEESSQIVYYTSLSVR